MLTQEDFLLIGMLVFHVIALNIVAARITKRDMEQREQGERQRAVVEEILRMTVTNDFGYKEGSTVLDRVSCADKELLVHALRSKEEI